MFTYNLLKGVTFQVLPFSSYARNDADNAATVGNIRTPVVA